MAQQARPKRAGQSEELRPHSIILLTWVVRMPNSPFLTCSSLPRLRGVCAFETVCTGSQGFFTSGIRLFPSTLQPQLQKQGETGKARSIPGERSLTPDIDVADHQNQQEQEQFDQPEDFELVEQDGEGIERNDFNVKCDKEHTGQEIFHREASFRRFDLLNAAFIRRQLLRRWPLWPDNGSYGHDQRAEEDSENHQNKDGECSHRWNPSFLFLLSNTRKAHQIGASHQVSFVHYLTMYGSTAGETCQFME